jgi:hypothetical protein
MQLEKYSMGIGDRFAHQGRAQLQAIARAKSEGFDVVPVWNKSHREHLATKSMPGSVRTEADQAVQALSWDGSYYVDADHIGLQMVDLFMDSSDFFTIDVADAIGQAAAEDDVKAFVDQNERYIGTLEIPNIAEAFETSREQVEGIANQFLRAVRQAGQIYRHIEGAKGRDGFVPEVSMDETDTPQTPVELFFILAAIADEGIPIQTIAPKFTGRFNKGVNYVGDVDQFGKEFEEDIAVIAFAVQEFGLPENLKLSVHSGSDKFSIYEPICRAMQKFNAGLHLKTAGTTWLEELIGLALAGGDGLSLAKEIYRVSLDRFEELCGPYWAVIDIDSDCLPRPEVLDSWSGEAFAAALRHDPSCVQYNPHFRQLLHVAYKVAAEMGDRYLDALDRFETVIAENVMENIYERHLKRIFIVG